MIEMKTVDACASRRSLSCAEGFSVVELMVSLAIFAVVAALALPSYAKMVEKRSLASAAEQMAAFVNFGQLESLKRNQPVTLSFTRRSHEDWCLGMTLGTVKCDCEETDDTQSDFCAIDGVEQIFNSDPFGNAELVHTIEIANGDSLSFDPIRGILLDPNDDLLVELHTDSRDYRVNLMMNATGSVVLCSTEEGTRLPGYEVCS
jgi:type IV fimbrial biogenesis protein FimT